MESPGTDRALGAAAQQRKQTDHSEGPALSGWPDCLWKEVNSPLLVEGEGSREGERETWKEYINVCVSVYVCR